MSATTAKMMSARHLEAEQDLLRPCGELDPLPADPGEQRDEDDAEDGHGDGAAGQPVEAEQEEPVGAGDLGLVGVHDDVGESTVQPMTQPMLGPMERVTQENDVPQSGSTSFMYL